MNSVAKAERIHIAIVGRRNVGKSSLINCLTNQELSIVSDVPGTTTDPVSKAVELLPYGPVVIVDTGGIDDEGELGQKRISRTIKALSNADFAILVLDARDELDNCEIELITHIRKIGVPYIAAVNKIEFGTNQNLLTELRALGVIHFEISCKERAGIDTLKRKLIHLLPDDSEPNLLSDLIRQGNVIVLVVPIDAGAPRGRLIKPQAQALREVLDKGAAAVVVKESELDSALKNLTSLPEIVITDSQVIMKVMKVVTAAVKLTTFSILMARAKGSLPDFVNGLKCIDELNDGDKILIAEACTHHVQGEDIGTIKIPNWFQTQMGKKFEFTFIHGMDFPGNLSDYKLIIHCGGCMLTRKAMQVRLKEAKLLDVPIVNYGVLISYLHGAIPRVIEPFEDALAEWEKIHEF